PRSIAETLRRAEQSVAGVLEARGVTVTREIAGGVPPVTHDADQLQQVLINLLKNAAEASPPGSRVAVQIACAGEARRRVVIEVRDEGCGIDADTRKTLFEPFFTTKKEGTGLGLYVSHEIVKRHGGSLSVASTPGKGSTFTVELPMEVPGG